MRSLCLLLVVLSVLIRPIASEAQSPARVLLDDDFSEWLGRTPLHVDPTGDGRIDAGRLDFGRLWMAHDATHLFVAFEVGVEINLQSSDRVVMYLDADGDPSTGDPVMGIGADLRWNFGKRRGTLTVAGQKRPILHPDIGLISSPTVTAKRFEVAIRRILGRGTDGEPTLRLADSVQIVLADEPDTDVIGDVQPDAKLFGNPPAGVQYVLRQPEPPLPEPSLGRADPAHLRVVAYNILRDRPFQAPYDLRFRRILRALNPDVIGFGEIYNHSAAEVAALMQNWLGGTWYANRPLGGDVVLASRYPILQSGSLFGNGVFLVDLRPTHDASLFVGVLHPPCCTNDAGRQLEFDNFMSNVRNARGTELLPLRSPMVLMGDMNLVGLAQQQRTLIEGAIVDTLTWGPRFKPDWDGTSLADLRPPTTGRPMTFTWFDEASNFSPGRLDYIVYLDAVMQPGNRFTLFTPGLSDHLLQANALLEEDAILSSDHLPVVADFALTGPNSTRSERKSVPTQSLLHPNSPNPFNPTTKVRYQLAAASQVKIDIYDALGRRVRTLVDAPQSDGEHTATFDATGLPSGVYKIRLSVADGRGGRVLLSRSAVLLR